MARPTGLAGEIIAHGPSPVAQQACDTHRAPVKSLSRHRFHRIPPQLANAPNDHSGILLLWSGLDDGHRRGMPSTTQGDLPSRPRIPHPSQLPIGRDEPPLPTLFRPRTGVEYDSPLLRPRIVSRYVGRGPSPVRTRTRTRWFSSWRQTLRQYCAAITAPQLGHTSASLV